MAVSATTRQVPVDWKAHALGDGVQRIHSWLSQRSNATAAEPPHQTLLSLLPRFITVDVLVPTFRVDFGLLRAICGLEVGRLVKVVDLVA